MTQAAWADREDAPPLDGRFEPETLRLVRPKLPKQHNSFDCGVYVRNQRPPWHTF